MNNAAPHVIKSDMNDVVEGAGNWICIPGGATWQQAAVMPNQFAAVLLKEHIQGMMMITAWCLLSISDIVAFAALKKVKIAVTATLHVISILSFSCGI